MKNIDVIIVNELMEVQERKMTSKRSKLGILPPLLEACGRTRNVFFSNLRRPFSYSEFLLIYPMLCCGFVMNICHN